jgi:hypothetical protein
MDFVDYVNDAMSGFAGWQPITLHDEKVEDGRVFVWVNEWLPVLKNDVFPFHDVSNYELMSMHETCPW